MNTSDTAKYVIILNIIYHYRNPKNRQHVQKIVLMVTDNSPRNRAERELAKQAVVDMRQARLNLIVVAVGDRVDMDFLEDLTSGDEHTIVRVDLYDELRDEQTMLNILSAIKRSSKYLNYLQTFDRFVSIISSN